MRRVGLLSGVVVFGLIAGMCATAEARKLYKDQFEELYIKDPDDPETTPSEKKLAKAFKEAQCNVCHVKEKPKDKKQRNPYGEALTKKLGKKNEKDGPTIKKAIEETGKELSDPKNPMSPKFGDLINDGKLPAG